jgi:hypothetical protein
MNKEQSETFTIIGIDKYRECEIVRCMKRTDCNFYIHEYMYYFVVPYEECSENTGNDDFKPLDYHIMMNETPKLRVDYKNDKSKLLKSKFTHSIYFLEKK